MTDAGAGKAAPTASPELLNLCASKPELECLIRRIWYLAPVVREQVRAANLEAERVYFVESGKPSVDAVALWERSRMMMAKDLLAVAYPNKLDTPEWQEFHSIGLAVAAFGGADAISELGWITDGVAWTEWDGMAGHWL